MQLFFYDNLFLNILLYADNIVLLTSNENDLVQKGEITKSNIMQVQNVGCTQSNFMFLFNFRTVKYCKTYKYPGTILD